MNLVDFVVIALALLAAYRGWHKGLVGQVFELGGGFLGLIIGIVLGPRIVRVFVDQPGIGSALLSLFVVLVALSIGQALGFVAGHRFAQVAHRAQLGSLNAGLGSGFGVIVTLVSFWLIGSLLVHGPSREIAGAFRRSALLKVVNDVMPRPPDLLAHLQQYLNTSGFPQVFAGLPPLIGPQVDLPPKGVARKAWRSAGPSTVRVVAPACGGMQLGTGWIAADETVVTNAHVVAGGESITIQQVGGAEVSATVVLFDARTDVAVLHTDGLDATPLDLHTRPLSPGAGGATLGFPGSRQGALISHRAAIQARFEPIGRDIYGRSEVRREVYEVRSPVRQGDSGGPFVTPDGDVAAVVFAASTTDADTGYALTGAEVSDEVRAGARSTDEVSTGPCTH
jgi:S1-C subfamily serine protease